MYTLAVTALSLAVIAGFALAGGGAYLLVKRREGRQSVLMLLAAAVLFANVLIWTL
jgi:LPXTG-motif cell wall-anchored protein